MARPTKAGLDYFPHSCIPDQRMELIEAEFGLTGYAVVLKLYEKIFVEKGYFCEWTKDVALMFARKNGVGVNVVSEIVNASIRRGIFDSDLFKKYQILTSKEIQETYLEVVSKRKRTGVKLVQEYLLADYTLFSVFSEKKQVFSEETSVYYNENSQRKVKKSKENKSKEEESRCAIPIPLRDGSAYEIAENTVNELQQRYSAVSVIQSLRKMADFLYNNDSKRREYTAMDNYIRWWLEQDNTKAQSEAEQKKYSHTEEHKPSYDISILGGMGLLD